MNHNIHPNNLAPPNVIATGNAIVRPPSVARTVLAANPTVAVHRMPGKIMAFLFHTISYPLNVSPLTNAIFCVDNPLFASLHCFLN